MAVPHNVPFPSGGTWFDTLHKTFDHVQIQAKNDNGIPTSEFLEAAESLTTLFDVLGSMAFTPVKNDMVGNIKVSTHFLMHALHPKNIPSDRDKKVRDRQLAAPAESEILQSLVINELKTKKHTASEGLLWLVRGLDFTSQGIRLNLQNPSEELSASFRTAYSNTLKPHHSFMVKPIFSAAMSATPYRKDFYAKLGDDARKVDEAAGKYLEALERQVAILKQFQGSKEAKW